MREHSRPARHWLTSLLMLATGVVAAAVLLEVALRVPEWRNPGRTANFEQAAAQRPLDKTSHPFLPYVGSPGRSFYIHWTDPEGRHTYKVHVRLNNFGFRTHDFPDRKRPEDLVVLALGGSTTWGAVAPTNADTWPELLEAHLASAYPNRNVRVYNLGLSGATTAMNVVILALAGIHLEPDLVIAYEGFNDGGPVEMAGFKTDHSHYFRDLRPESDWFGFHRGLPSPLRRSRAAVRAADALDTVLGVNSLLSHVTTASPSVFDEDRQIPVERIFANLLTVRSIAEGHGARALFSTFQFFSESHFPFPLNPGLRRAFADHGMDYVDIEAAMPNGDRSLQVDECHFTDAGREMVAALFFRHIMERGLLESWE